MDCNFINIMLGLIYTDCTVYQLIIIMVLIKDIIINNNNINNNNSNFYSVYANFRLLTFTR
mgnify:CR=1 FL=1